ncbi:MAG TPA: hypothetical protein VK015_00630, partial [Microbacterium sp.]|nr:hypothetical protein [Microbacterium sp.]
RDRTKHQVAEVTSLGLVQMTRKKIGLGLLETFSEPCEVCAGRGVIVHHDPVAKHRSSGSSSGRRSRGGNGGGNGNGGAKARPAKVERAPEKDESAHVNTESAKSALAKIAASTIGGHDHASEAEAQPAPAAAPASLDQLATILPEGPRGAEHDASGSDDERPRKPRRRRASDAGGSTTASTPSNSLLDSVLNALPEPKAPGQGRSRRRVTTAALQGTAVDVTASREDEKD